MSLRFLEVETAKSWAKAPSEFRALPREDRLEMLAFELTQRKREAVERRASEKAQGKQPKRGQRRG